MLKYLRLKQRRSGGPALTFSNCAKRFTMISSSTQSVCVLCAGAMTASAFFVNLEVFPIAKLEHQLNEEIRDKEIRVIGDDGSQLGIMSSADAQRMAYEKDLDLVKIAPNAVPPVCKIMDYGKFRFEQLKKEKEAKKN